MIARRSLLTAGFAAVIAALTVTPAAAQDTQADNFEAVATFSILGDLVRNVGGDRLERPDAGRAERGRWPRLSPTPGDARKLAAADVVFVNGLGLEGWMTRLVAASGAKASMLVVTKGIAPRRMDGEAKTGRTAIDTHAWQSVADTKIYIANIRDGLVAIDPAGKATYEANAAAAYLAKLDELENEIRAAIARVPADREVITSHDAFGYFGTAYGMAFIAPEAFDRGRAFGENVAKIVTQVKRRKLPRCFWRTSAIRA